MKIRNLNSDLIAHKIVSKKYEVDNVSIEAGAASSISIPNTLRTDGYSRVMMNVSLTNATTSGINSSMCNVYHYQLVSADNNANSLVIIKNFGTITAKIKITSEILYSYDNGLGSFRD